MIVCTKCGAKFKDEFSIPTLAEVQKASDDIYTVLLSAAEQKDVVAVFRGCPYCLTAEHLQKRKSNYKRKYRRGGHILSLDELMQQEFIFWLDKVTHRGWFMGWQLAFASKYIGPKGCIYYAIKNEEKDEGNG